MDGRRNFRISIEGTNDEEQKKALSESLRLNFKNQAFTEYHQGDLDVEELEKTKFEKKLCHETVIAAKNILNNLKLKKFSDLLDFRVEDIHILSPDEFNRLNNSEGNPSEGDGFHEFGNIFLPRNQELATLLHTITHELGHVVQYSELKVRIERNETSKKDTFSYEMLRRGPQGVHPTNNDKQIFTGLKEACAEKFAIWLRQEFNENNKDLNDNEKNNLRYTYAYDAQLNVMHSLVNKVTSSEEEAVEVWKQLIRDHVTGGYTALNWLETKFRGVTKIISEMGVRPKDALLAAQKLKLTQAVIEISADIERDEIENNKKNGKPV